jgi:hypothetical protein
VFVFFAGFYMFSSGAGIPAPLTQPCAGNKPGQQGVGRLPSGAMVVIAVLWNHNFCSDVI